MQKKPSLYVRYDTFQVEGTDDIEMDRGPRRIHCGLQCPRCHAIMISSSELDRLDYLCKECSFLVHLPKKWAETYLRLY
jgi:hypothetical protein